MTSHPSLLRSAVSGAARRSTVVAAGLAACLALGISVPARAASYSVSFDTSSIAGSVDFQWNLGTLDPSLTATVFSFTGTTLDEAPVLLAGEATGRLDRGKASPSRPASRSTTSTRTSRTARSSASR